MIIETHSHLDMQDYEQDIEKVIENCKAKDIEKVIIAGVAPKNWDRIVFLIEKYDMLYASLGVHPSEAITFDDTAYEKLENLLSCEKVVGIGEIGLDYYYDKESKDLQKEVFRAQLELAQKKKLPVLIHDREAHLDCINILKEKNVKEIKGVMHCFSGSVEFARECIKENLLLGIGGIVTFKNAQKLKEVVQNVDLSKIVLETDCPFLSPEPKRGERNEPSFLPFIAKKIADLKNSDFETVCKITTKSAKDLFKFN